MTGTQVLFGMIIKITPLINTWSVIAWTKTVSAFAEIYQVKDIDELDNLIAALDAAAVNGMTIEYHYTPLDSSGIRCEYLTLDDLTTEGAEEKVLADLESTKGLEMTADAAKSVDFVLREKAFGFQQ